MITIKVCIGSSCFIKNAPQIIDFLNKKIEEENLTNEIVLKGSLCTGNCNKEGVTVFVNDKVYPNVTVYNLNSFWDEAVAKLL